MGKKRTKIRIGGQTVEVSSLEKVLFPDDGITKGDLIEYYRQIARVMIPHIRERPLAMRRYPGGIGEQGFVQQKASSYFPTWIDRITVDKKGGKIVHAIVNTPAALVYLVNQNMITPHVWLSRADRVMEPDQIVFDLDPPEGDFVRVRDAARAVRKTMQERGLTAFVMTTGSKGLHVRAPIERGPSFDEVRAFSREMAEELALAYPDELTTEHRIAKRKGRIYLDINRVAYAQTAVPPYAVRGLPGAPVATPITWDELGRIHARSFTIRKVPARVKRKGDPWKNWSSQAVPLPAEAAAL